MKTAVLFFALILSSSTFARDYNSGYVGAYQANEIIRSLNAPWGMAFSPSGRLFVTEKGGKIKVYRNNNLQYQVTGIPRAVSPGGQGGLMDIVFHPEYPEKPYVYLSYSTRQNANPSNGVNTRVSRFKLVNERRLTEEKILVQGGFGTDRAHFGCRLAFDKKGFLFITLGERHNKEKAQDLKFLNGKILRLHDDGRIPSDNPFTGVSVARGEIFSYGHRNPQGLDIHPTSDLPYISEHGPTGYDANLPSVGAIGKADEVNLILPGKNYGWPILFGDPDILPWTPAMHAFARRDNVEPPVIEFSRPDGIAPSGAVFYTGDKFPGWKNDFFIAALRGYIIRLKFNDSGKVLEQEKIIPSGFARLRDVTTSPDGNLLAITANAIIKIKPGTADGGNNPDPGGGGTGSNEILTIWNKYKCLNCHVADINTTNGAVPSDWVTGPTRNTKLYRALRSGSMPMGPAKLTKDELDTVRKWINRL